MCFISRRPLTYRVIIIKELYDLYYTAITLTTLYKYYYCIALVVCSVVEVVGGPLLMAGYNQHSLHAPPVVWPVDACNDPRRGTLCGWCGVGVCVGGS